MTRRYGFDEATNRTSLSTYAPGTAGACQTTTPSATRTPTYDRADRATTAGYAYDALGRATTMPAADATNPLRGRCDDRLPRQRPGQHDHSERPDPPTTPLDVVDSRTRSWADNVTGTAVRATNHYADDGDKPIRTQESATAYTRNVDGLAGLSGIWQSATNSAQWQISNLNGDIVAAVAGSSAGLTVTREFDEFGRTPSAEAGRTRYGWLGKEQRASDAPAGLMLMGSRLYNPGSGRFLSTDPVYGGNANGYDYCAGDVVNLRGHYRHVFVLA